MHWIVAWKLAQVRLNFGRVKPQRHGELLMFLFVIFYKLIPLSWLSLQGSKIVLDTCKHASLFHGCIINGHKLGGLKQHWFISFPSVSAKFRVTLLGSILSMLQDWTQGVEQVESSSESSFLLKEFSFLCLYIVLRS